MGIFFTYGRFKNLLMKCWLTPSFTEILRLKTQNLHLKPAFRRLHRWENSKSCRLLHLSRRRCKTYINVVHLMPARAEHDNDVMPLADLCPALARCVMAIRRHTRLACALALWNPRARRLRQANRAQTRGPSPPNTDKKACWRLKWDIWDSSGDPKPRK